MSRTIRNEKTKGWLDKLQKQRETRKAVRQSKEYEYILEDYIEPLFI